MEGLAAASRAASLYGVGEEQAWGLLCAHAQEHADTNAQGMEVCWRGRGIESPNDIAVSHLTNVEIQTRCGATLVSCGSVGDRHPAPTEAGDEWPHSGFRVQKRTKHLVARPEHGQVGKEQVLGGQLSDHVGLNGITGLGRRGQ